MKRSLLLLVFLAPVAAWGDDVTDAHPYLQEKYFTSVGLFLPDQAMKLGLDASIDLDPTPYVDFSETFAFNNSDEAFSAEFGWRFANNWQLRGQYFRVDNNARVSLEQDIEWGDVEYSAGTSVAAGSDMQITRLFFGRTFRSSESREFGLGIGAHILDLAAYIEGNARIDDVEVGNRRERASIAQPLPNFGAWYMHAFDSNWAAMLRFDWLSASVGKYDGRIINSSASIGYAIGDHFGLALAYNYFELAVDIDDGDWQGRVKLRFNGPYIALTGYW
jgi:hypothetical protein